MNKIRLLLVIAVMAFGFSALSAQSRKTRSEVPERAPVDRSAASLAVSETPYDIDAAKLDIQPANGSTPDTSGVTTGGAQMTVAPEVAAPSTTSAVGAVTSGFTPLENVRVYLAGALAATLQADANGVLSFTISTGATPGRVLLEAAGVSSGKRVGGVYEISATGPFAPGLAAGPHAVNTTVGGATLSFITTKFPASATVTIKRNGATLGTLAANANGVLGFTVTPANNGNTAAVYTTEVVGTPGTMAGISIEERSDAGTPPATDQNPSRAFVNRAVFNNTTGGSVAYVGEGFLPAEIVAVTGCANGGPVASVDGAVSGTLTFTGPFATGGVVCVLTGVVSLRVARFSVWFDPQVTNTRAAIVDPVFGNPGGVARILVTGMPPNDQGSVAVDGTVVGSATTDALGNGTATIVKPTLKFLHGVEWITSTGVRTAAPLMLAFPPTAGEVSLSGRVTTAEGRGITNARVTVSGGSLAEPVTVLTNRRGSYVVEGLTAGQTYVVSVSARRYSFEDAARTVTLNDSLGGFDFTAGQ